MITQPSPPAQTYDINDENMPTYESFLQVITMMQQHLQRLTSRRYVCVKTPKYADQSNSVPQSVY